MNLRRAHSTTGMISVAAFVGTGFYMHFSFPELHGGSDLVRSLYRSNHTYILMAGLLNLLAGRVGAINTRGWKRRIGHLGAAIMLITPWVLMTAFFVDPPQGSADRPLTAITVAILTFGVMFRLVGTKRSDQ